MVDTADKRSSNTNNRADAPPRAAPPVWDPTCPECGGDRDDRRPHVCTPRPGEHIDADDPGGYFSRPINKVDPLDSVARHHCWAWRRQKIWEALCTTCQDKQRLARFANCGACAWLQVSGDELRVVAQHCGDRFCLPCQLARGHRLHRALAERMKLERTRFATLTLKHRPRPLTEQLAHLYESFTRLRRSKAWKRYVSGGAAFLEVKLSDSSGEWHPHLHLLLAGDFFPVEELRAAWLAATGDSTIVDIRAIGTDDAAAKYVTKYVTKPAHFDVIAQPQRLIELVCALHGRRSFSTFGEWHAWPLDPPAHAAADWRFVAPLSRLIEPQYRRWMEAAARRWPALAQVYGWPLEHGPAPPPTGPPAAENP